MYSFSRCDGFFRYTDREFSSFMSSLNSCLTNKVFYKLYIDANMADHLLGPRRVAKKRD